MSLVRFLEDDDLERAYIAAANLSPEGAETILRQSKRQRFGIVRDALEAKPHTQRRVGVGGHQLGEANRQDRTRRQT
jgi:hypothetical protein